MVRRTLLLGFCALSSCQCGGGQEKPGAIVARGSGFTVTAPELVSEYDRQPPQLRQGEVTLEKKKAVLEEFIRLELLAREAEKQGLQNDPDVKRSIRATMAQALLQKRKPPMLVPPEVPEGDLRKYFEEHSARFNQPGRVNLAAVAFVAPAGSPERAGQGAAARNALQKIRRDGAKSPPAFFQVASEFMVDRASRAVAAQIQAMPWSRQELERDYSAQLAEAAFGLKPEEVSGVVEAPQGFYVLKCLGVQPEVVLTFEMVKEQIARTLAIEKQRREFDAWLGQLREKAKVTIDDKAVEAVQVRVLPREEDPAMAGPRGGMVGGPRGEMMGGPPDRMMGGPRGEMMGGPPDRMMGDPPRGPPMQPGPMGPPPMRPRQEPPR